MRADALHERSPTRSAASRSAATVRDLLVGHPPPLGDGRRRRRVARHVRGARASRMIDRRGARRVRAAAARRSSPGSGAECRCRRGRPPHGRSPMLVAAAGPERVAREGSPAAAAAGLAHAEAIVAEVVDPVQADRDRALRRRDRRDGDVPGLKRQSGGSRPRRSRGAHHPIRSACDGTASSPSAASRAGRSARSTIVEADHSAQSAVICGRG